MICRQGDNNVIAKYYLCSRHVVGIYTLYNVNVKNNKFCHACLLLRLELQK